MFLLVLLILAAVILFGVGAATAHALLWIAIIAAVLALLWGVPGRRYW